MHEGNSARNFPRDRRISREHATTKFNLGFVAEFRVYLLCRTSTLSIDVSPMRSLWSPYRKDHLCEGHRTSKFSPLLFKPPTRSLFLSISCVFNAKIDRLIQLTTLKKSKHSSVLEIRKEQKIKFDVLKSAVFFFS